MVKYKRICAYCGKKCDMKKDYCIPQDRDVNIYRDLIGKFYYYDEPLTDLIRKKEK